MLYQNVPLDFEKQVLVFIHIPKTAGSSLSEALRQSLGPKNCVACLSVKYQKVFSSALHRTHWNAKNYIRNSIKILSGSHPLLPSSAKYIDTNRTSLLHGSFPINYEPNNAREPIYIAMVRDPVERFISQYYYDIDVMSALPEKSRKPHHYRVYDMDSYVDYVYERRRWTDTNLQCRFIGGDESFEAARAAIDHKVFLVAPVHRSANFAELLGPVLSLDAMELPRINVGQTRQNKPPPSAKTRAKIADMVPNDRRLFDYVCQQFHHVYGSATTSKRPPASAPPRGRAN